MEKSHQKLLLMQLFDRLRKELSLPLGIGEYQLLLDALEKGQGLKDGKSLMKLCETIWIKSREDRELLEDMLTQLLEEEIAKIDELARKEEEARRKKLQEEKERIEREAKKLQAEKNQEDKSQDNKQEDIKPPLEKPDTPRKNTKQEKERSYQGPKEEEVGVVLDLPLPDENKSKEIEEHGTFILTDSYLPLSIREMKQIWRMLRHSAKGGTSEALDISATVQAIAKDGIVIHPIYQSDKVNKIQLILMVDHDGSMVAFNALTQNLIASATAGGGHANAEVYYFNNCPVDFVYTSPNHIQHKALSKIYNQASEIYTVVMIVSDAGAARGNYSPERVAQTQDFLEKLKKHVARIAWLNPMPRHRWNGTSAYFIKDMVPMFELRSEIKRSQLGEQLEKVDSRKGMKQVVSLLQGKKI